MREWGLESGDGSIWMEAWRWDHVNGSIVMKKSQDSMSASFVFKQNDLLLNTFFV